MPNIRSQHLHPTKQQGMERIRILFLIPSFKTGGAEIQLLSLVRGLDKSLFAVTVAVFYRGHELEQAFEQSPATTIIYLDKKGPLDFSFVRRLYLLIRKSRFDIVQSYNVSARLFGMITAKRAGVPVTILTERTASLLYSSFGSRIYLFFEKFAIRSATLLIANSQAGREFAISRGLPRDRTRVIYNGVDSQRFHVTRNKQSVRDEFSIPASAFLVGMVARIEALKDPFTFVSAAKLFAEKYENSHFMLVGDGPILESVKAAVFHAGLHHCFCFAGRRADVADLLNSMDVVVLTSKHVEGCSNSLLEAMFLGKPVIATRVGGNAELLENEKTGFLIPPSSPAELAQAIERLYHDNSLRTILGENARRLAEAKFTQKSMVQQHENLYLELFSLKNFSSRSLRD